MICVGWKIFSLIYFQSKPEIDYLALFITIWEVIDVLFAIGIVCELGERSTGIFSAMDEAINDIDWHLYPIEIQRMLPIIMIVTQKPIFVKCFGSIAVTRETFKMVCMIV